MDHSLVKVYLHRIGVSSERCTYFGRDDNELADQWPNMNHSFCTARPFRCCSRARLPLIFLRAISYPSCAFPTSSIPISYFSTSHAAFDRPPRTLSKSPRFQILHPLTLKCSRRLSSNMIRARLFHSSHGNHLPFPLHPGAPRIYILSLGLSYTFHSPLSMSPAS